MLALVAGAIFNTVDMCVNSWKTRQKYFNSFQAAYRIKGNMALLFERKKIEFNAKAYQEGFKNKCSINM